MKEILDAVESAIRLGELGQAQRILERYQEVRQKFSSFGVFDIKSWQPFDLRYDKLQAQLASLQQKL